MNNTTDQNIDSSIERFDFILENETGVISSDELITYLTNINLMMKSINHTLNGAYTIGYDQIVVDVEALERGSVKIPIILRKVLYNPYTLLATGAIFGAIANNILSDDKQTIVYNINNSTVNIEHAVIVNNKSTTKAVSEIAKTIVNSENVTKLKLNYLSINNEIKSTEINKDTLKGLIVDDIVESEKETRVFPSARLIIVSPVLENTKANWKVRIDNNKFSAKMMDDNFLELMDEHKIAFGKGDVIIADLETIITKRSDNTPNVKHNIQKVHEYPRYSNQSKQKNLFSDY